MKLSFLEQNTITDYNHIGAISGRCLLVQQGKSVAAPPLVGVANKGSQESLSEAPFRQINSFLISVLLGEGNGTHSCILAWIIPWTEESCGLQSMGSKELDMTE